MTPPRPETTDRSEQHEQKTPGAQLSATQVVAGALAAVSAAVVASFFGLAGTLIGAALASVVSTVSAALYGTSMQRTNERLRRAREQLAVQQARAAGPGRAPEAAAAPATQVLPGHVDPRRATSRRRRPRWATVAAYAAAVFVVAMGIVTGIELVGQRPVSALVGATETSTSTTIGAITHASSSSEEPDQDPSTPSSPTGTAPTTGSTGPTAGTDDGTDDEAPATPTTTAPTPTPEAEPTADSTPSSSPDEPGDSPRTTAQDDPAPADQAGPTG